MRSSRRVRQFRIRWTPHACVRWLTHTHIQPLSPLVCEHEQHDSDINEKRCCANASQNYVQRTNKKKTSDTIPKMGMGNLAIWPEAAMRCAVCWNPRLTLQTMLYCAGTRADKRPRSGGGPRQRPATETAWGACPSVRSSDIAAIGVDVRATVASFVFNEYVWEEAISKSNFPRNLPLKPPAPNLTWAEISTFLFTNSLIFDMAPKLSWRPNCTGSSATGKHRQTIPPIPQTKEKNGPHQKNLPHHHPTKSNSIRNTNSVKARRLVTT